MRSVKRWTMSVVLLATGCAGSVADEAEPELDAPQPLAAARRVDGLRYIPLHRNHPEQFVARIPDAATPGADEIDMEKISDEALAQHMIGFTEIDGWVYRVEPELELVRR